MNVVPVLEYAVRLIVFDFGKMWIFQRCRKLTDIFKLF